MAKHVCINRYLASHGVNPKGRGQWVFRLTQDGIGMEVVIGGSYTEAKRHALRRADDNTDVVVMP